MEKPPETFRGLLGLTGWYQFGRWSLATELATVLDLAAPGPVTTAIRAATVATTIVATIRAAVTTAVVSAVAVAVTP